MTDEPMLPEFADDKIITVNTKWHSVEIAQSEMASVIAFCNEHKITQD